MLCADPALGFLLIPDLTWGDLGLVLLHPQGGPARPWGIPGMGWDVKWGAPALEGCVWLLYKPFMAEVLAKELALTALSPCPQAFCDDASGLKFNPVLYPKVR